MEKKKIKIGISSCLLGHDVRYDGKSKKDNSLIEKLAEVAALLPICPEVEIGMTVPRERIRLEGSSETLQLIAEESGKNWTDSMNIFTKNRLYKSDFKEISGLILKSKSPSCGINNTKVYQSGKLVSEDGTGLFASKVILLYPSLPIIDEIRLLEPDNFSQFISSVIKYAKGN